MKKVSIFRSLPFLRDTSRYIDKNVHLGSWYQLSFPTEIVYVVNDVDVLRHCCIVNEKNYPKSKIYWGQLRKVIGNALGTLDGEEWLWMKRLQRPFFSHEMARSYIPTVIPSFARLMNSYANNKGGLDLTHDLAKATMTGILKSIFGGTTSGNADEIAKYIAHGENIIAYRSAFPWRPFFARFNGMTRSVKNYLSFFDKVTREIVYKRKSEAQKIQCMMDQLIMNSSLYDAKLSMEDIRNEIIVHLGASTETVAVALTWTLYLLQKHPKYRERVIAEIAEFKGEEFDPQTYSKLPFLTKCVKESLRLYPPSHALTRDATKEDIIQGHKIKAGSIMYISTFGIHRNPKYWEEPNVYNPNRFDNEANFKKNTFVPFGAGRHTCIGRYLAMPQMVLSIAYIYNYFNIELLVDRLNIRSVSTLKPDEKIAYRLIRKEKTSIKKKVEPLTFTS